MVIRFKIKFPCPQPEEKDEDGKTNYASMTGTIGRAGLPPGADDMMSEMAKRLAARRAKAEGLQSVSKASDSDFRFTVSKTVSRAA